MRSAVKEHLVSALRYVKRAAAADDTLVSASQALSAVLAASVIDPDLGNSFPTISTELGSAIQRAKPVLLRAISGDCPTYEMEVGLQALEGLLSQCDDLDLPRRQLHVGLLGSELNALHCRRELGKCGGLLSPPARLHGFASRSPASLH